jgi:hypothetical protein
VGHMRHADWQVGDVLRVCSESGGRFAGLVGQVTALSEEPPWRCRMQFFRHRARPWIFYKHFEPVSDLEALAFLIQLEE